MTECSSVCRFRAAIASSAPAHDVCYACGAPAVSDDHAPAKVFFPAKKDLGDGAPDLRVNLLTVRSCAAHNGDASKDDEYVAFAIAQHFENNKVALGQITTKIIRAFKRDPAKFGLVLNQARPAVVHGGESVAFSADLPRMQRVFDRIGRALYLKHFGRRYEGGVIRWMSPSMRMPDGKQHEGFVKLDQALTQLVIEGKEPVVQGHIGHPSVFEYGIVGDAERPFFRFKFYEGFVVLGASPKSVAAR